jgi:hypothetical protein
MRLSRFNLCWVVLLISTLVSCSSGNKNQPEPFSQKEKDILYNFANVLKDSINRYDFELLSDAWDADAFKKRVRPLSNAEQAAFNVVYQKEMSRKIFNVIVDMVNKLKFNNGRIYLTRVVYYPNHLEVTYSLVYNGMADFLRFRLDLESGVPKITDYFLLREEKWQSRSTLDLMSLNSSVSNSQKRDVYHCMRESDNALQRGDTLSALDWLGRMPKLPGSPYSISHKRIQLAYNLSDSVFYSVLESEIEGTESTYVKYLYSYFFGDSILLDDVLGHLRIEAGRDNRVVDSLSTMQYFWN